MIHQGQRWAGSPLLVPEPKVALGLAPLHRTHCLDASRKHAGGTLGDRIELFLWRGIKSA